MDLGGLDVAQILEQNIGHLHRHTAEVRDKVRTGLVASDRTFCCSAPCSER